jgi:hypothetical protein
VARVALDAERAQVEASRQGYLERLQAHMIRMKHSLGLDKMLEETKVRLEWKKRDLKVWEATLVKALERGIHPRDNMDLLAELVELKECLAEVEVDRAGEAKELAALVNGISGVLMDPGLDSIQWIPQVLSQAWHVLEAVVTVLERLCEVPTTIVEART